MDTITVSHEQKVAAIQLALAFAVGEAKEIRYGIVQETLNYGSDPTRSQTEILMHAAIKVLFPNAEALDDVSTADVEAVFAAVSHAFEKANNLKSMVD